MMKGKHLYIIGNGFDIHHEIPSKYFCKDGGDCFRKWLDENDCDTLCEIEDNFGYNTDEWWSRFEDNLASIETLRVAYEEAFEHYPDFGSDDFHDRDWYEAEFATEQRLNKVYYDIAIAFERWIAQLPHGNNKKKIKMNYEDSLFISFNYTHTLEELYGIPSDRILHIHGCVGNGSLIFGHGYQYEAIQKKMEEFEMVEDGDYVYQRAKDAAISGVASHRKNVEEILNNYRQWFDSLNDIAYIHIFGHSLGDVDLPYFHRIFDSCNKSDVFVEYSCRNEMEYNRAISIVQSQSIPLCHFRSIDLRVHQILKERYLEQT